MNKNEKGFVIAFVMAVTAALSIMTGAMFFYYDNDLKFHSEDKLNAEKTIKVLTVLRASEY